MRGKLGGQRLGHVTELPDVRLLVLEVMDSAVDQDPGVGDLVEELGGMEDRVMHHGAGREKPHAKRLIKVKVGGRQN